MWGESGKKCWPSLINFRLMNLFRLETNYKSSGCICVLGSSHLKKIFFLSTCIPCRHTSVNTQNFDTNSFSAFI